MIPYCFLLLRRFFTAILAYTADDDSWSSVVRHPVTATKKITMKIIKVRPAEYCTCCYLARFQKSLHTPGLVDRNNCSVSDS